MSATPGKSALAKTGIPSSRWYIYITIGTLLVLLAAEGLRQQSEIQRSNELREIRRAQIALERTITAWEDGVAESVMFWLAALEGTTLLVEGRGINTPNTPYFDGFYLWDEQEVVWPVPVVKEDLVALHDAPCMKAAAHVTGDRFGIARAITRCMGSNNPALTLYAASEALQILIDANEHRAAWNLLQSLRTVLRLPLESASVDGLSVRRLVALRGQEFEILQRLDPQSARTAMLVLAEDIGRLDAASLEAVSDLYAYPVLRTLVENGAMHPDEMEQLVERAQRRQAVLDHLRGWTRNITDAAPTLLEGPRRLVDSYNDPPFLLFYARMRVPDPKLGFRDLLGGAQLDMPQLLLSLYARADQGMKRSLSVRNATGQVIFGTAGPLVAETAFTRIFPDLRVGLTRQYLAEQETSTESALLQLLPLILGELVGALALFGLIRADRRQVALLAQQREFIARVTHELKTPLAGIRLMAENLEMGTFRDDAQREKFARQIIKESERLTQRVEEIINSASRPEETELEEVDLNTFMQEIADRWKPLYEQQQAVLIHEFAPIGKVKIMRSLLRDVVYNLLDNALKYRRDDRPAKVWFRVRSERRWLVVEIEDNGMGVPPKLRTAIFERFRRVEGPGRGRSGGHGLGLAFVADAAKAMDGKVECREGVDGGARFLFRLPKKT